MTAILEMPQYVAYQKNVTYGLFTLCTKSHTFNRYCTLITCVIARSNPRRLLPIWREKLRGHYHVTMTFDNDFCVWRWHYRERHLRVSVNAQTIARNAPRFRALITSRNDRHVWTDRNSFTGIGTEMIKMLFYSCFCQKNTHKTHEIVKVAVINDNNNFAPSLFRSLCEFVGDCFGPGIFLRELRSLRKIPRSKTITSDFTQWPQKRWCAVIVV